MKNKILKLFCHFVWPAQVALNIANTGYAYAHGHMYGQRKGFLPAEANTIHVGAFNASALALAVIVRRL